MKLSLGMIVKPSDEEAVKLERCLESVAGFVDSIFLTITGNNAACEKVGEKFGAKISHCPWEEDFAKARTFNMDQIPKDEHDYFIWFDCDDIVIGAENIPAIIERMRTEDLAAAVTKYLYAFDEYGSCIAEHPKIRIVKLDGSFLWSQQTGELHEDLMQQWASPVTTLSETEKGMYFEVRHEKTEQDFKESAERNYKISLKQTVDHPDDPRSWWNLANSCVSTGKTTEARDAYERFIPYSGSQQEVYLARIRLGMLLADLEENDKALNQCLQAMVSMPWHPDAYLAIGKLYYKQKKWKHSKEMLIQGMSKEIPEDAIVYNPRDYDYNPMILLANCYFNMGKVEEALTVVENLRSKFPMRKDLEPIHGVLKKNVEELADAEEFCRRAETLTDVELAVELEALPTTLKMNPVICIVRNRRFVRTEAPEKEIVYYCGFTTEVWDSSTAKTGIGGSEEAVINLSREWSRMGYKVVVFNNCGAEEKTDEYGVEWRPYWSFNPRSAYDNLILWRSPVLADHQLNARNIILDLHDVLPAAELTSKRLGAIHHIAAKSNYHRSLFPLVTDDRFDVIGNGIDLEQFKGKEERKKHRLIYTSSPDRGLEHLLDYWPKIKEHCPLAELHVFYGWHVFDTMFEHDNKMQIWKERMKTMMQQEGIINHGRVGHEEIAREMMKSEIFAYPCHFEEIFCISAVKAQAAGCKVVATKYAALPEVVKEGQLVEGGVKGTDMWNRWCDTLIYEMGSDTHVTHPELVNDYSWSKIAETWPLLK